VRGRAVTGTGAASALPDFGDWRAARAEPLAQDASARRYRRLRRSDGRTAILMSAPVARAADRDSLDAFCAIAAHLRGLGLSSPEIYRSNRPAGQLLLEDLGDTSLARLLADDRGAAQGAYAQAAEVLAHLETAPVPAAVPRPDLPAVVDMIDLTLEQADCGDAAAEALKSALSKALATHWADGTALALRDYHADNLMWLPDRAGPARIGLLDFQDAMVLPRGYDLASLLDDPRRDVPRGWRRALIAAAAARAGVRAARMTSRVNALSLLRNLRILGIFRRLSTQAARPRYARYIPRTIALIEAAARDASLRDVAPRLRPVLDGAAAWYVAGPS